MKRAVLTAVLIVGVAVPAFADITLKQTTTGKGMGMSGTTGGTTYIKGGKMRTDVVMGDKTQTTIFDIDTQKMYSFDSKKKEADVFDMAAVGAELSKSVDMSSAKASFKPNGQKKEISGKAANGYDMHVSMDSALGGAKEMTMTVTLEGPVWIVANAPGAADYAGFYKAAVEKGWIFSDPRAAKAQPGQAKAMAEMYNQIAATGGIPYQTEIQIKLGGGGPMGGLMARMGNVTMTTTIVSVEVGPVTDDMFAPPAGYKLNARK
jgi:hypothetical protein